MIIFSEVACCSATATIAQEVMDSVLAAPASVQHGPREGDNVQFNSINSLNGKLIPNTAYSCISQPLQNTNAYRKTNVATPGQSLLTVNNGTGDTAAALFQASDMQGGKGALVVFGDINPLRTTGTLEQQKYIVQLFSQALTGAQDPDKGFCATVAGNVDVTALQFDKTIVTPGEQVSLQVDINNPNAAAVTNESVTLLAQPGLDLAATTATLTCPSGTSTINIVAAPGNNGQQNITLAPLDIPASETCTVNIDFTVNSLLITAPDTVSNLPANLQAGLSLFAPPTSIPSNTPWGVALLASLLALAGISARRSL